MIKKNLSSFKLNEPIKTILYSAARKESDHIEYYNICILFMSKDTS